MSFIDTPIDDTVQLDEMAAEADDDNFHNFPPAEDDVRIVGGNERCPSEEEHSEIERKKNMRNLERPRIATEGHLDHYCANMYKLAELHGQIYRSR